MTSRVKTFIKCGAWDGNQCRATANLTACAMTIQQGKILKGPAKVLVHLCPRHFQFRYAEAERGCNQGA